MPVCEYSVHIHTQAGVRLAGQIVGCVDEVHVGAANNIDIFPQVACGVQLHVCRSTVCALYAAAISATSGVFTENIDGALCGSTIGHRLVIFDCSTTGTLLFLAFDGAWTVRIHTFLSSGGYDPCIYYNNLFGICQYFSRK